MTSNRYTRRDVLQAAALASAGIMLQHSSFAADAKALPLITKPIPSSGEKLPVIGIGTNAYGVSAAEELAARREVLKQLPVFGGSVVDTAPAYGTSEVVIGDLVAQLGNRNKLFLATKVTANEGDVAGGKAMLEESFRRLKTQHIDLVQVHNLRGIAEMVPVLVEMKAAKRIRYIGITTSNDDQHEAIAAAMRQYPLDFIQVNYSLGDRESAATILPLAQERKIAVLLNIPFGGRRGSNLFARVKDKPVPDWAADFDATSWAHVFLKYAVSHPAVTCAIPGTTKLAHLEDNQQAARGRLPDAAMRVKIEKFWDALS
jgi:aryl-alcohol dehydrogenase-like predicted oxidoreductase